MPRRTVGLWHLAQYSLTTPFSAASEARPIGRRGGVRAPLRSAGRSSPPIINDSAKSRRMHTLGNGGIFDRCRSHETAGAHPSPASGGGQVRPQVLSKQTREGCDIILAMGFERQMNAEVRPTLPVFQ